jgi:hypothetical protein
MDAPAVAVASDGKKLGIAWMDMRPGRNDRNVYWTTSSGGAFAPEASPAEDAGDIQAHPSMGLDGAGTFHVVFESGRRICHRSSAKEGKETVLAEEGAFPSLAVGKTVGVVYEAGGGVRFRAAR